MDGSSIAKKPSEIVLVWSNDLGAGSYAPPVARSPEQLGAGHFQAVQSMM